MKYLSLFSGIGGFELGIQQAYEDNNRPNIRNRDKNIQKSMPNTKERTNGPTCIGYSEIDKYAIQVYEKHFNHHNYGDITKINPKELPDFDLLVCGFPCQSFSIAGKRGGFNDTRGTLFFEIARIIREKQPRLLLLENVKGLLSHDKGGTFTTIISTLDELGYDCQWQVLNSKNFGVPQNRERVFIIGHLRGTNRPEVFPITGANRQVIEQINQPIHSNNRVYGVNGISPTLNTMQGGNRQPFIGCVGGLQKNAAVMNACSPALTSAMGVGGGHIPIILKNNKKNYEKMSTMQRKRGNKHQSVKNTNKRVKRKGFNNKTDSQNNREGSNDYPLPFTQIRRLTPIECERLQSFPDNWTEGLSDTQRYKCLGNAVTVNVVREIIKKLYPQPYR